MLEECLGAEDPDLARVEARIAWEQVLRQLASPLREVIELRYYQDLSQKETAQRLGVSQMQVSRLERRAIDELRQYRSQVMGAMGQVAVPIPSGYNRQAPRSEGQKAVRRVT